MASDYTLICEGTKSGKVKGECQRHVADCIDLVGFSWGESIPGSFGSGSGGGTGKVELSDLIVTKHIDMSTPVLMMSCASNEPFKTVEVHAHKSQDDPYLVIALQKAVITNISLDAGNDGSITEHITFNYDVASITYRPQQDEKTLGGAVSFEHTKSTSK